MKLKANVKNGWLVLWFALGALVACHKPSKAAYFRHFGGPGYQRQVYQEACFNPKAAIGDVTACTSIPFIYHSFRDGYILIPNEDWSLLSAGGAWGPNTAPLLTLGSEANLAPAFKLAALSAINALSNPGSFANLKGLLSPAPDGSVPDVTISIGAKWGAYPNKRFFKDSILLISIGPAISF